MITEFFPRIKQSDEQSTPQEFFDGMSRLAGPFYLDACASKENAKCSRYYTKEDNCIKQPWDGVVWCNYPYSNPAPFLNKAYMEAMNNEKCGRVVVLGKFDCSTKWWNDWVRKCELWWLVDQRMRFNGRTGSPNFLNYVAVFGKKNDHRFMGYLNNRGQQT